MGRGFVRYHLPESGRDEGVLFSAFIDYRLEDGTKLHILQDPAWCPACDTFVVAEEIPSVEAIEEEIRGLESGDPELLKVWEFVSNGAPVARRIAELRQRLRWRRGRRSPPRCLHCGAIGVIPIPHRGEFRHPHSGERVIVTDSGFADTQWWCAQFSPEGEHLGERKCLGPFSG
jgi:hypothetical protein